MSEARMQLRSSISTEERERQRLEIEKKKTDRLNRPFLEYHGQVNYVTNFIDCAAICDELIEEAAKTEEHLVIGFDMEWPFNFQTGSGKTAVIQISPNLKICHILHISQLKSLPKSLSVLLTHPKIKITGVNIKNDVRKLARDFSGFNAEKMIDNCIDSGVFANSILPFTQRWSMEKLVDHLLKKKINKDKKVRMSRWHIIPLSKEQQIYAATDAYASLLLYLDLKERAINNCLLDY